MTHTRKKTTHSHEDSRKDSITSLITDSAQDFSKNITDSKNREDNQYKTQHDITRELVGGSIIKVDDKPMKAPEPGNSEKKIEQETLADYFKKYPKELREYILQTFNQKTLLVLSLRTIQDRWLASEHDPFMDGILDPDQSNFDFILNDDNSATFITTVRLHTTKPNSGSAVGIKESAPNPQDSRSPAAIFQTVTVIKWDSTTNTLHHDLVSDKGVLVTNNDETVKRFYDNRTLNNPQLLFDYANDEIDKEQNKPVIRTLDEAEKEFQAERQFYLDKKTNPLDYAAQRRLLNKVPYRETKEVIESIDDLAEKQVDKKALARSLLAANLYVATNGSNTAKHSLRQVANEHNRFVKETKTEPGRILSLAYQAAAFALKKLSQLVMMVNEEKGKNLENTSRSLHKTALRFFHSNAADKITQTSIATLQSAPMAAAEEPLFSDINLEAVQSRIVP